MWFRARPACAGTARLGVVSHQPLGARAHREEVSLVQVRHLRRDVGPLPHSLDFVVTMRPVCARQTPRAALGRCKPASVPVQRRFATQSSSGSPHPKKGGPHQCWSCKVYPLSFRDAFFCGSCGTVQPETNEVDCFQKIGLCALPAVSVSVILCLDHSSMTLTSRTWTQDSKLCRGSSTPTSFMASRRLHSHQLPSLM